MNQRQRIALTLILLILVQPLHAVNRTTFAGSTVPDGNTNDINSPKWRLIWQDEFNGNGRPDPNKWQSVNHMRYGNARGADVYWLSNQARLNGRGQLAIKFNRMQNFNNDGDAHDYATAMIRTKNIFERRYGKYEIRCKLPKKPGWWVSFWMMSDSVAKVDGSGRDGTEIDILEAFGWNNNIHHALHWDGYGRAHRSSGHTSHIDNRDAYHTYTLVWTPQEYRFYIDNHLSWVTKDGGVSQVKQYLKISGEASTKGWMKTDVWAKNPDDYDYPDEFLVDYVRVYAYDFGVDKAAKKTVPFATHGVESAKTSYAFGERVTFEAKASGNDLKYQYYLSYKGKNLDVTPYGNQSHYSFVPQAPGHYHLLAFAFDGNEIKEVGQRQITVKKDALQISKIDADIQGQKLSWRVHAKGDGLLFSYYVIYNNKVLKYIKYNPDNTVSVDLPGTGKYKVLVYVQDEFGNTMRQYSRELNY